MTTPTPAPGRKAEQSQATRELLVRAARELFAERGYADTGTDAIARRARVSRGALYHQFRDKQALFHAVYEQIHVELLAATQAAIVATGEAGWEQRLRAGLGTYLDFFMDAGRRRIVLQDAPGVLDWNVRDEIHMQQGLGFLVAGLASAMQAGEIAEQPASELGHVMHGALNEGAMTIARAGVGDEAELRRRIGAAIDRLLAGLRPPPSGS